MGPSAAILPWIQTVGVVIAAISLVITMWNTFATRRAAEASTIFDLWSRYEGYRAKSEDVADTPFDVARRPFLDLANFIEHLCFLANRRAVPRAVRLNLESLVLDYLAITNRRSGTSYEAVLGVFRLSPLTYAETSRFIRRRRSALKLRESAASEVVYGPFKTPEDNRQTETSAENPAAAVEHKVPILSAEPLVQPL